MKKKFLEGVSNWNNHLPLLWMALEKTGTGAVLELGCGDGSTRQLHEYCKKKGRKLYSFDTSEEWLNRFRHLESDTHKFIHITPDWDGWNVVSEVYAKEATVALIDHSPGERRVVDLQRLRDVDIIVCHDTEAQPTAAGYEWERGMYLFQHSATLKSPMQNGYNSPWATAVSNKYNLYDFIGQKFDTQIPYQIV